MDRIRYIMILAVAVLTVSCEKENGLPSGADGNAIEFGSFRKQVFTRADIDLFSFDEGTKYALFAVGHAEAEDDYAWSSDKGFDAMPTTGVETSTQTISYAPIAVFPQDKELDFYALTYGNGQVPEMTSDVQDGVTPTIALSAEEGRFPDLMHSNEVKERNAAAGKVILPFEHALSALNFTLAKQDESGDDITERQLENVVLTKIRLDNDALQGTMNLVTGEWTRTESGSRTVFDGSIPLPATPVDMEEKDILTIPNDGLEEVKVTIALEGLEEYRLGEGYVPLNKTLADGTPVVDGKCEISLPVHAYNEADGADLGAFRFLRNHKYTLSILVMRDNVRVVAVSPQVYEWQDVDLSGQAATSLGQPVVFGGLMWMDRNLGASSADCENDWWHSCGYFYQYARNIPYIINLDGILAEDGKSEKPGILNVTDSRSHYFHQDAGSPAHGTSYNDEKGFYMIYTFDEEGNKCYDWYGGTDYIYELDPEARTREGRTYVALRPGEKGYYGMMMGGNGSNNNRSTWARTATGSADATNGAFWLSPTDPKKGNPENQPVPKGWRLPTRADGYRILPEPAQNNNSWMEYKAFLFQGRISDLDQNIAGAVDKLSYVLGDDNYRFQYVRGRIHVNSEEAPGADRLTSIGVSVSPHDTDADAPCIYGIKRQGTPQAYRIRIRRMQSNVDGRYFLRISQYPSNESEIFKTNVDPSGAQNSKDLSYKGTQVTRWNLHEFDWEHPAAELDFPLQGYIDAGGTVPYWNQVGICTIMRLPEYQTTQTTGYNWTFYMRNATSGVAVGAGSRRALGDCIRLVRDLDAVD